MVCGTQRFKPKKNWVFGLDLNGKPKTQKKNPNPKKSINPKSKPKKRPKIYKIQNPNPIPKTAFFWIFKLKFKIQLK
jgi:hypothetical protein